jgi:endonuclease III
MSDRPVRQRSTRNKAVDQNKHLDISLLTVKQPPASRKVKREKVLLVSPDPIISSGPDRKKGRTTRAVSTKKEHGTASKGTKNLVVVTTMSAKSIRQRPTPEECAFAVAELGKLHPSVLEKTRDIRQQTALTTTTNAAVASLQPDHPVSSFSASSCGQQPSILDGVVATMLSQNTTSANSTRAFAHLKKTYQDWNEVAALSSLDKLIDAIRVAGLAQKRAHNIWNICKTLVEERGEASLEYLRDTPHTNEQIQAELLRFPGLGVKTVSCVLMFTMGRRDEFPVDTHVHRISKQHHWVPCNFSRDAAYQYLNSVIPNEYKMDLHCLLVQHGRECHRCAARGKPQFPPKDGSKLACPLAHLNDIASGQYAVKMGTIKCEDIDVKLEGVSPDGVVSST